MGGGIVVASSRMAGLRYVFKRSRDLDPILFRVAAALVRTGDVVWDVGANVGLFAASAAGLAGRNGQLYAIEADSDAFSFLQATATSQPEGHAPISCVNVAVSNACGIVQFDIAKRSRSANSIAGYGSTQTGGVVQSRLIPSLTLDVLLSAFSNPSILKIDVEGAEMLTLQGADRILSTVRPAVFIEVCAETSIPVANLLRSHGYVLLDGSSLTTIGDSDGAPWDTVAVPSEKMGKYFPS